MARGLILRASSSGTGCWNRNEKSLGDEPPRQVAKGNDFRSEERPQVMKESNTTGDAEKPNSSELDVDTKSAANCAFGNYGFIRVRRRKLKGGPIDWREFRARHGHLVTNARSFDLVRSVRIDGKPRQKFLLGLGSIKEHADDRALCFFWSRVIFRLNKYGIAEDRRREIINEMADKGAQLPARKERKRFSEGWRDYPDYGEAMSELSAVIAKMRVKRHT
jgi:hypothetical protein